MPEAVAILKVIAGGRKDKGAVFIQTGKTCHVFPFEIIPKHIDWDKESVGRKAYLVVSGQDADGNDVVHVHMVIQFLVQGV